MPSYRYTKDIRKEELDLEKPLERTRKEKLGNWWHYSWKIIAALAAFLVLISGFVGEIIARKTPDFRIGVISPYGLPDELIGQLEEQLAKQMGDVNGDGTELVQVEVFVVEVSNYENESKDPYGQMAGVTKLMGELSVDGVYVFMAEKPYIEEYQKKFGIFGELNGQILNDPEIWNEEKTVIPWPEISILAGVNMKGETDAGFEYDGQDFMVDFLVGRRNSDGKVFEKKEDNKKNWQESWDLLQKPFQKTE